MFSILNDDKQSQSTMNKDLERISKWDHQWKMLFNPDLSEQATEEYFSRNHKLVNNLSLMFNKNAAQMRAVQKHLGLCLDSKLHRDKIIGIMKRFCLSTSRNILLTIYKSFVRPHPDCSDIL